MFCIKLVAVSQKILLRYIGVLRQI